MNGYYIWIENRSTYTICGVYRVRLQVGREGAETMGRSQKKLIFICAARISFIRLTIMLRDNIDVFLIFRDTAFERINNSVQGGVGGRQKAKA